MKKIQEDEVTLKEVLKSPTLFVMKIIGVKPLRYQAEFLEDESERIIVVSGRQCGKTTMIGWKAIWTAFVKPRQDILIIAPTFRQAQIVYQKILEIVENNDFLKSHAVKLNMSELRFDNNSVIRSLPAGNTGEFIRGYSSSMILFDEASIIPDEVFVAVEPSLAVKGKQLILSGTPFGKRGYFYNMYEKAQMQDNFHKEWSSYKIKTEDNPLRKEGFLESRRETMTAAAYAQEYEAEFLEEVGRYYSLELVLRNAKDYEYKLVTVEGKKYYVGVDVARMGLDETAIVIVEKDEDKYKVIYSETLAKVELTQVVGRVIEILRNINVNKVYIDSIGIGAGVVDMLKERITDKIVGINLEGKRRAEAYNKLKVLLEQGKISLSKADSKMLYQFGNYTAKYSSDGVVRIIKEASGHDDLVDALVLALSDTSEYRVGILEGFDEAYRYNEMKTFNRLSRLVGGVSDR